MHIELHTSCWRFIATLKDDLGEAFLTKSEVGPWHDLWASTGVNTPEEDAAENVGHYVNLQKFNELNKTEVEAAIKEYLTWQDGFIYTIIRNRRNFPAYGAVVLTGDGPVNGAHFTTSDDLEEIYQFLRSHGIENPCM